MSIFLDNKYTKIYYRIITKRASLEIPKNEYSEIHHIIPESFYTKRVRNGHIGYLPGDPDDPTNLVELTPREHFVCHLLLVKMVTGKQYYKMVKALNCMINLENSNQTRYRPKSSRVYDFCRRVYSEAQSHMMKGEKNPMYGKKKSTEAIEKQVRTRKMNGKPAWNKGLKSNAHLTEQERALKYGLPGDRNGMHNKNHSEETKLKQSNIKLGRPNFKARGKIRSEEHSKKISESLKGNMVGKKNPCYDHTLFTFVNENMDITEHTTKRELVTKYNLNAGAVSAITKGKRNIHKGWTCIHNG